MSLATAIEPATSTTLTQTHIATLSLWQQVNASLSAYYKLIQKFGTPSNAMNATPSQWEELGIHSKHIERHKDQAHTDAFISQVQNDLNQGNYQLIFAEDKDFPAQLNELYDPPPLLFARGNIAQLHNAQIAIVGSRKPSPHAQKITFDMAQYLANSGYIITSGLAQGVDSYAHQGALSQDNPPNSPEAKGRTIGVLGTGIDIIYPRHHDKLFHQIIADGGCLVTELLPGTPASRHTFPRRNRLVAGLSLGTIVTEATIKSGSLITARLTSEQGKQVFAIPSHIDNANAEGCHHLIREGATLIYHPNQVIEDIQYQGKRPQSFANNNHANNNNPQHAQQSILATQGAQAGQPAQLSQTSQSFQSIQSIQSTKDTIKLNKAADVPTHLQALYEQLDWTGVDLDTLVNKLQQDTQTLLGQLMELELMGLIMQQGGRYLRS